MINPQPHNTHTVSSSSFRSPF